MNLRGIWYNYLGGKSTPWADLQFIDGEMKAINYNKAFVDKIRGKLDNMFIDDKTDQQIVDLFYSRETLELEEPQLDVKHAGIDENGRIKMELDWNSAFIKHLAENGIQAESEEETIQLYLSLITHQTSEDIIPEMLSVEDVDAAFHDLDQEAQAELEEAARQVQEKAAGVKKSRQRSRQAKT